MFLSLESILVANEPLSTRELAVVDLGAPVARGGQEAVSAAFEREFDGGLILSESKERGGQLYTYCGFPRALDSVVTLMKVATEKKPEEGRAFSPLPEGNSIDFGTLNQTKLCGGPVVGELFEFHP